jgi:hypothetical protein
MNEERSLKEDIRKEMIINMNQDKKDIKDN